MSKIANHKKKLHKIKKFRLRGRDFSVALRIKYGIEPQQLFDVSVKEVEDDYDIKDVNESVKKALLEVKDHLEGKIELTDAREFFNSID